MKDRTLASTESLSSTISSTLSAKAQKRRRLARKVKARARRLDAIDHLGPEAVTAFVDGEMTVKAMHRVRVHIVHCAECREDVHRQRLAASWVKSRDEANSLRAPMDLLEKLNDIAFCPGTKAEDSPAEFSKDPEQDILDKLDMIRRALRRGAGGN